MSSGSTATAREDRFRCPVCGREFASDDELERHVRDAGLLW